MFILCIIIYCIEIKKETLPEREREREKCFGNWFYSNDFRKNKSTITTAKILITKYIFFWIRIDEEEDDDVGWNTTLIDDDDDDKCLTTGLN